jgi:hypothetical protein
MNDWRDVWSAKTIARINSQEVSSESYRYAVSAALAQWDQSTGDLSDRLPDHMSYMAPPSVIAVADEPIIHSPNLPIPGGSEVATQGATDREGMPGRPVPQKRSWLTGEGTWLRSNDEPAPTDRTWWQFGGEMVRSAVELTPAMQFNKMVQQSNEYFDRPVYFNEMADALDGSTQNIMNIFSFGATDYVGATQTDTFQGWQWDWQRGLFTVSRELFLGAATGGSGTMMSASTGTARYAWGGVWIAGLGYDSYNMGQHSSQAYEDFRQGDIRGGLWHTGLAVVSAFGIRAGLKGSALGKAGSTVDESSALAKVADEAPKGPFKGNVPTSELNPTHRINVTRGSAKKAYDKLKADIAENGIKEPIRYVENGGQKYIVDGHHRLRAARELGLKEVPVQQVELPYGGYKCVDDLLDYYNN